MISFTCVSCKFSSFIAFIMPIFPSIRLLWIPCLHTIEREPAGECRQTITHHTPDNNSPAQAVDPLIRIWSHRLTAQIFSSADAANRRIPANPRLVGTHRGYLLVDTPAVDQLTCLHYVLLDESSLGPPNLQTPTSSTVYGCSRGYPNNYQGHDSSTPDVPLL